MIHSLNDQILPALHYTPIELLTGSIVNTVPTLLAEATTTPLVDNIEKQLAYTRQQQMDVYSHIVEHANEREAIFNAKIDESRINNPVVFHINDLVQVYRSDLDYMFHTACKFLPKWGTVCRIVTWNRNSYKLATLEGLVPKGWFSAHRLCCFMPWVGTNLEKEQKELLAAMDLIWWRAGLLVEDVEDVPEEGIPDEEEGPGQNNDETEGDEVLPEGDDKEEDDKEGIDIEADEEAVDDGMALSGWGAPGRLMVLLV